MPGAHPSITSSRGRWSLFRGVCSVYVINRPTFTYTDTHLDISYGCRVGECIFYLYSYIENVAKDPGKPHLLRRGAYTFVPHIVQHIQEMLPIFKVVEHSNVDIQKCALHELDWVFLQPLLLLSIPW